MELWENKEARDLLLVKHDVLIDCVGRLDGKAITFL